MPRQSGDGTLFEPAPNADLNTIKALMLTALALLLTSTASLAQTATPQAKTWNFKDIVADDQYSAPPFRSIVRADSGLLYVADSIGVLEFDGIRWRRLPLADELVVTTLGVTSGGEIIVGGSETLLAVSHAGQGIVTTDLSDRLPGGMVGLGHFWEFARAPGQWCVRSEPALICSDGSGLYRIDAEVRFGRLFAVHGELYVRDDSIGLKRVAGRQAELALGGEYYANRALVAMFPTMGHGLAGISRDPFTLATWSDDRPSPVAAEVNAGDDLNGQIGSASVLLDGAAAIPFVNGDVLILDPQWSEVARLSANQFGATPGAQAVHADAEGGVWISWFNAITRIDWPSRLSVYRDDSGTNAMPEGLIETEFGMLAHSSSGLTLINGKDGAAMLPVDARLPWINGAIVDGEELLVLTMDGLRNSDGEVVALAGQNLLSYARRTGSPNEILIGMRFGVARIVKEDDSWVEHGIREMSFDVFSIVEDAAGDVWMESNLGRVARIKLAVGSDLDSALLTEFDADDGLPNSQLSMGLIGGEIHVVGSRSPFLRFARDHFEISSMLPWEQTGAVASFHAINGSELLVAGPTGQLRLLHKGLSGDYIHQPSAFDSIAGLGKIYEILVDRNDQTWLATDSGVVRVDPAVGLPQTQIHPVLIRQITTGELLAYDGNGAVPELRLAAGDSLRVDYALPSFRAPEINRYRSRVRHRDGDEPWGRWSNETRRDFTNLPAGDLLFEVQARDAADADGGMAVVPLIVSAPWYRQTPSIVAFWIALALLVAGGVQWRVRALRARSIELEEMVALKTEALQLAATTDPLTGLWNRHRFGQWVREESPAIIAAAKQAVDGSAGEAVVCVIDLDHFKRVNDQHGHAAGDAVLKGVADRLRGFSSDDDLIFRFGGEEFVFVAVGHDREQGKALAERIVSELGQTTVELENGVQINPTGSVGWSAYPFYRQRPGLFDIDFVLGVADRALYLAKERGRNRAVGFLPKLPIDEIDRTRSDWRAQLLKRHTELLREV